MSIAVVLCALLFAPCVPADAANVVRAYTCLTGGTTGCVDKTPVAEIANGDIALAVTGDTAYIYQFHSAATDAESSPTYIRPDDYSSSGVWYLVSMRSVSTDTGRSSTPAINFYDSDATDSDINAKIYADCTDTGSGTEDCDLYFQVQVGGTLTTKIHIDADGAIDFQANNIVTTGTISGKPPTVVNSGTSTYNVTAAEARAGTLFITSNAATTTYVLPAAEAGMTLCIRMAQGNSQILRVDTDGTDYLVKPDGARTSAAGDYYGATASASNKICVAAYDTTDWYVESTIGTWAEE